MEHSLGLIKSWSTNPTSVTLRKLKSYQTSFLTKTLYDWKSTTRKKLKEKHKQVETKQHTTKQQSDHLKYQRGN